MWSSHFEIQHGGPLVKIRYANCYHRIPWPLKHTFRHQNKVDSSIWLRDNRKCRFHMAAILKSNMVTHWYNANYAHWIPWPQWFRHQNQVSSIIWPRDNRKYRFHIAAILKSNMADIESEIWVAQYPKMFGICQSTCVPNLLLVSQNAQTFWLLGLNHPTNRRKPLKILKRIYGSSDWFALLPRWARGRWVRQKIVFLSGEQTAWACH